MIQTIEEKDSPPAETRPAGGPPHREGPLPGSHVPFSACQLEEGFTWKRVLASTGGHVLALIVMAGVPIVYTTQVELPARNVRIDFIVEDFPVEEPEPAPMRVQPPPPKPRSKPRIEQAKTELIVPAPPEPPPLEARRPEPVPEPIVEPPRPVPPPAPPVRQVVSAQFDRQDPAPPAPRSAPAPVRTDLFSEGSSAVPTTKLPAREVQTGGFGSPDGVAATKTTLRPGAPQRLGSFDLPQGPGKGNGTGGSSGAVGTVASAGFGNGVATGGGESGRPSPDRTSVRPGGFSDGSRPPAEAAVRPRQRAVQQALVPIEIVSKPKPLYTAEARRMRLEGEVVLEVTFPATGQPRVLRVVKGLGHGLDEEAVRAAEQIQFKPARRDGHAVDITATVRMVFQLA